VTVSPDGRNLYVASSTSDAIAIFRRNATTGRLTQATGRGGCISAKGAGTCATAIALDAPNSVAVSADGRNVYATARNSSSIAVFTRNATTGALTQATDGSGCITDLATAQCTTGRALRGADVVTVSPDGRSVYVGAFFANAVATFVRDPSTGTLTQPADASGCLVDAPVAGCTTGLALGAPEGMAISADGTSVYVAAALGNALVNLRRDPSTGTLTQAADGSGCVVATPLAGCATGVQLSGANAVAVSPDDATVYVTSLLANSVTTFTRTPATGAVTQQSGTSACVISVLAVGCSLGRAFAAPEGIAVSPDGASVYGAAFGSSAVDVLDRTATTGAVMQKPRAAGCVTAAVTPDCTRGRALRQTSSVAVSPDGRYVYAGAFGSDAVSVFRRITKEMTRG
jgi:DNA-binding beta-propeller fold protein YncE